MKKPVRAYTDGPTKYHRANNNSTANVSIGSIVVDSFPRDPRSITPQRTKTLDHEKLVPPGILKNTSITKDRAGKRNMPDYDVNSLAHRNSSIATNN
jgi:hypothetical protein